MDNFWREAWVSCAPIPCATALLPAELLCRQEFGSDFTLFPGPWGEWGGGLSPPSPPPPWVRHWTTHHSPVCAEERSSISYQVNVFRKPLASATRNGVMPDVVTIADARARMAGYNAKRAWVHKSSEYTPSILRGMLAKGKLVGVAALVMKMSVDMFARTKSPHRFHCVPLWIAIGRQNDSWIVCNNNCARCKVNFTRYKQQLYFTKNLVGNHGRRSWGGGRRGTRPQYFWGGDGYGSVPPNNFPLSYIFYGSLAFTCTSTVCTRIHKEQRTLKNNSHNIQDTPRTILLASPL